ncbi:MAG: tetratricopeptide repeat protein [Candidatus Daviesbacteria bacterium]|nr:tetratricopeptide repeat protein [Candidatus Daviesbacteria bacterium]
MTKGKIIFILIIIGFVVYFNGLFNNFVWDDEEQVVNNVLVHSITNIPSFFSGSTFNTGGSGILGGLYYKPIMSVSYSFIYTIFGPNAFFFHLLQLTLHITNSIFVFLIFNYFFKKFKNGELTSFFLALIFLVHPINTEAVIYIASIQDVLFFFFGIFALWIIITKTNSFKNLFISSFLLLFSLLSKETGFVFIPIILSYLFLFKKERLLSNIISMGGVLVFYSFLRFALAGIYFNKHGLSPITRMPIQDRIFNIPEIIIFYLKTFFYPLKLSIAQHWVIKSINYSEFYLPLSLSILFFILLIILAIYLKSKAKDLFKIYLFFFLWFIFGLGLHLQIFPLDMTVAERWFYLPEVGLLGIFGIICVHWAKKIRPIFLILIILLILGLSLRTIIRNTNWKDGLTLYSNDIVLTQGSFDLENNLGVELYRVGKFEQAKTHFENSTKIAPFWWTNWNNLGVMVEKEDYKKALSYYQKAIENGSYYLAYENVAKLLLAQNKITEAKEFSEQSLKVLPNNPNLWLSLAYSEYKLGNKDQALYAAKNAFLLSPSQQTYYIYSRLKDNLPLETN